MKKAILVVLVFIIMQVVVPIVATYIFGAYDMSFGKTGKVFAIRPSDAVKERNLL